MVALNFFFAFFTFVVFIFYLFPIYKADILERCDAINIVGNFTDFDSKAVMSLSLTLAIKEQQNNDTQNIVQAKDIIFISTDPKRYNIDYMYAFINQEEVPCNRFYNLTFDCSFYVKNSTFYFEVDTFGGVDDAVFFGGIVDELSFSMADGSVFSKNNLCKTDLQGFLGAGLMLNISQCCTSLNPIPVPTQTAPACTAFKSRSTISNPYDNYRILFTSEFFYFLTDKQIDVAGTYSAANGTEVDFVNFNVNDFYDPCNFDSDNSYQCQFPLYNGTNKLLFTLRVDFKFPYSYMGNIGRLILRDGQTLMEEGIPFDWSYNCAYFTESLLYNGYVLTSNFCCTKFEGDV